MPTSTGSLNRPLALQAPFADAEVNMFDNFGISSSSVARVVPAPERQGLQAKVEINPGHQGSSRGGGGNSGRSRGSGRAAGSGRAGGGSGGDGGSGTGKGKPKSCVFERLTKLLKEVRIAEANGHFFVGKPSKAQGMVVDRLVRALTETKDEIENDGRDLTDIRVACKKADALQAVMRIINSHGVSRDDFYRVFDEQLRYLQRPPQH